MDKKEYHRIYNLNRYHRLRAKYIEMLGSKCMVCGSTNNINIDHKIASEKTIDVGKLLSYAQSKVIDELKKCQLLCESCHIAKTKSCEDGYDRRAKGGNVNLAKLNVEQVKEILTLRGKPSKLVCAEFGVTRKTVENIWNGSSWKHVPRVMESSANGRKRS